jgi:hypothetical protein
MIDRLRRPLWQGVALGLWCALALGLAALARHGLVEAGPVAAHCDAGGAGWRCIVRSTVIQAFILQRLGWTALILAALAWCLNSRWLAGVALFAACAGLVLYSVELCAPASLLAAIVFIPPRRDASGSQGASARHSSTAQ